MTVLNLLFLGEKEFKKLYTDSLFAASRARLLYQDLFNKETILLYEDVLLKDEEIYKKALERIVKQDEPYEYVVGFCYMHDLKLYCKKPTLIPRMETEYIFSNQFEILKSQKINSILDLCTGSGNIAILASCYFPYAKIDGSDVSLKACNLAKKNIMAHKLNHQITIFKSDLFAEIKNKKYDLIVSNPPYISLSDYRLLENSVKCNEDISALTDQLDGLTIIKKIILASIDFLNPGGVLLLEIDINQASHIIYFAKKIFHLANISVEKDQFNRDRLIKIVLQ